jgi:hypothetical protein
LTNKIVRANNVAISGIKSVVYKAAVNATTDLRPGCVSSAMIEVSVYGAQSTAPSYGEPLTYYTVDSEGNETYIGTFYAEPSIQSRATYTFVAFDVVDKLNVDFSERLLAIQNNFPMTLANLVSEACTVAGVTLATTSFPMASTTIQSFYVENIKCRDVLSYAAEIACRFVRCDANEQIIFDWYALDNTHRIYPTSGSNGGESYVAYKQNGLNYQNYSVANPGCVAVKPLGTENAAYIYPDSYEAAYATDPLGNGVVTLYNLTAVDDGNGGISLSGDITDTDDGNGNVEMEGSGSASAENALVIANNILLTNANSATMSAIAQHIYTQMLTVPVYRPSTAELFPSENPYHVGDIANVTDIQGVSFVMPIMALEMTQASVSVEATGNESYDAKDYGDDTAKQLRNLSNSIVQIDRLKVGYAEIDTAVIDSLEANGINADWINAGALTIADKYSTDIAFQANASDGVAQMGSWFATDKGLFSGNVPQQTAEDGRKTYMSLTPDYGFGLCNYRLTESGGVFYPTYVFFKRFNVEEADFPDTAQSSADFVTDTIPMVDGKLRVTDGVAASGFYVIDNNTWRDIVAELDAKPTIGFVSDSAARSTITIPSSGYVSITPPALPTGAKIISVAIVTWTSSDGAFNIIPYGGNAQSAYLIGTPGVTISGLRLRFWYEIGV